MSFRMKNRRRRKQNLKIISVGVVLTVVLPSSRGFTPAPQLGGRLSKNKYFTSQNDIKGLRPKSRLIYSTKSKSQAERNTHKFSALFKGNVRKILNPIIQGRKKQGNNSLLKQNMALDLSVDVGDLKHLTNNAELPFTLEEFAPKADLLVSREMDDKQFEKSFGETIVDERELSEILSGPVHSEKNQSPGILSIAKFALPAIGVWLCGPLLSLIDTAIVGLFAGTNHQAALSPAVALADYASLLLAFLFAATTNLVSASASASSVTSSQSKLSTDNGESTQSTLISSLQLSTVVGAVLGCVLFTFAKGLLTTLIGNEGIDPKVFEPAAQYVKIRALGMPAAAILGSAQAACLGMKDIRSPLMILGAAAGVNLLGDLVFVGSQYSLLNGAAGAAWATIFSQYSAVFLFLKWLKARPKKNKSAPSHLKNDEDQQNLLKIEDDNDFCADKKWVVDNRKIEVDPDIRKNINVYKTSKSSKEGIEETQKTFSTRGFLYESTFKKRNVLKIPKAKEAKKFLPYVVPVTTTSIGRVSLFLAMAHVSSSLGTVGMAAQQIVLALFEAFCPVVDSLSLTAQSFIPVAIAEKESLKSSGKDDNLRAITMDFIKSGILFGSFLVLAVSCIPLVTRFFTTDMLVMKQVHDILPYLGSIFAMHGVVMSAEGVLLGRRDLNFLGWMYGIYFAAIPALMLRVKHAALAHGKTASLAAVWKIFLGYQVSRTSLWVGRALWLSRGKKSSIAVGHASKEEEVIDLDTSFTEYLEVRRGNNTDSYIGNSTIMV